MWILTANFRSWVRINQQTKFQLPITIRNIQDSKHVTIKKNTPHPVKMGHGIQISEDHHEKTFQTTETLSSIIWNLTVCLDKVSAKCDRFDTSD